VTPGIPSLADLDAVQATDLYREMRRYSERFLTAVRRPLRWYRWSPRRNPLLHWSRRWEYPFAAEHVLREAARRRDGRTRVLDAGSGVTFFPFFLAQHLPDGEVVCCDSNRRYVRLFRRIGQVLDAPDVWFVPSELEDLQIENDSVDAVVCLSVLEHTDRHAEILDALRRVLRPGGRLILTFDVSLDGRGALSRERAGRLLSLAAERFEPPEGFDADAQFARLDRPDGLLTTDHIRATEPERLPWPHPFLKSVVDLLRGRGWSGGFYRLAPFGAALRRPGGPT
jgi:SAM-dependent methyltransferase